MFSLPHFRLLPVPPLLLTFVIPLFSRIFLRVAMCWGGAVARFRRAPVGRNADKGEKWRGIEGQRENNWMLAAVFNLMPRKTSDGVLRIET